MQIFPGTVHGRLSASSISHATNASWVFCFCFWGLSVSGGMPSGCGSESKAANREQSVGLGKTIGEQESVGACEFGLGRLFALKLQEPLQVVDDRIQRAVLVIGRAAKLDARRTLGQHLLLERLHQAGFANPRLTAEEHHLPRPSLACVQRRCNNPSSSSRPTNGVKPAPTATSKRLCAALSPMTRYTDTGVEMPLRVWGPRS